MFLPDELNRPSNAPDHQTVKKGRFLGRQRLHQVMDRCTHPLIERPEGMPDRSFSDSHHLRCFA